MGMFGRQKPQGPLTSSMRFAPGEDAVAQIGLPMPPQMPAQQQAKDQRWLEGGKFTWKDGLGLALGYAGDALSGRPMTASLVNNAMQHQRDLREAQQQRTTELSDWLWKQQWQRDHPAPVNNDTVNDYNFISGQLGQDAGNQYLRNLADPMVTVPLGNGSIYSGPRSGLAASLGGNAPAAPVGKLTPIPEGGPTQPASGGFRPYR